MKKFMFTALALVAFSGVSMAKTDKKEEVVKENPCKATFSNALTYAYSQGATDDQAWQYASVAYALCDAGFSL